MWWPAVVKSEWELKFPLRLDYGRSPHAYANQRLQIQLELPMMSGMPLETCWAFNERWNNKFYYNVASCWLFLLSHIGRVLSAVSIFRVTCVTQTTATWHDYYDRSRVRIGPTRKFKTVITSICVPIFLREDLKTSDLSQGLCSLSLILKRCVFWNICFLPQVQPLIQRKNWSKYKKTLITN